MDLITLLGYCAALISTISFAPQAWKIIASRDTSSISFWAYLLTVAAFALWLTYGLLKQEWPLVVSNAICLALSGFILAMKVLSIRTKDGDKPA